MSLNRRLGRQRRDDLTPTVTVQTWMLIQVECSVWAKPGLFEKNPHQLQLHNRRGGLFLPDLACIAAKTFCSPNAFSRLSCPDYSSPQHHRSSDGFQFQPPLPPGSPSVGSPPPLPQSTPPATPTPPPRPKGTPPLTPTNGSPALRGRAWGSGEEARAGAGAGEEDALTLEELEEQQRLIWAALENADTATNSDSETPASGTPASGTPASGTPASGTPVPSSPSISTPVHVDTETEMEEGDTEEEQGAVELPGGSQEDEDEDGDRKSVV